MRDAGAAILPVTDAHAAAYARLPAGHSDPFDLLLAAVTRAEGLRMLTADAALFAYVKTIDGVAVEKP